MGDRGAISARCYGGSTTNRAPGQVRGPYSLEHRSIQGVIYQGTP